VGCPVSSAVNVVLVDKDKLVRAGLALLIGNDPALVVAGEAESCAEVQRIAAGKRADIVLWHVPASLDDFAIGIRDLKSVTDSKIVLLVNSFDPKSCSAAIEAGVRGIVDKAEDPAVLIKAIKKVHSGELWLERMMMVNAITTLSRGGTAAKSGQNGFAASTLSTRELEVVSLVCLGLKNKEIAERLFISSATVRHHLSSIFNKIDVEDRLELVLYAFKNHIVELPH
jgi:DNA-binding NarL/FixJ family response regulator